MEKSNRILRFIGFGALLLVGILFLPVTLLLVALGWLAKHSGVKAWQ